MQQEQKMSQKKKTNYSEKTDRKMYENISVSKISERKRIQKTTEKYDGQKNKNSRGFTRGQEVLRGQEVRRGEVQGQRSQGVGQ